MTTTDKAPIATERHAPEGKLGGRVALVTGGTRGIGAAISRSLANQGATVAAGYGRDKEHAEKFLAEMHAQGVKGSVHQGNIGSATIAGAWSTRSQHGSLDILINNAGITIDKTVLNLNDADWTRCSRSTSPARSSCPRPRCGTWWSGHRPDREHLLDHRQRRQHRAGQLRGVQVGLFGLTKTLDRGGPLQARQEARRPIGVTVNTVDPGLRRDRDARARAGEGDRPDQRQIPAGRLGQPEEIARVVHFLGADAAGYITGQVWGVNGGMEMAGA